MTHRTPNRRRATRRAFSLLEVLVVVAIIVVLAGLGTYFLLPRLDEAKANTVKAELKTLTTACQTYKLNNDDWPPSLAALAQPQPSGGQPIVQADALMDPWGQPYQYDINGTNNQGLQPDIFTTNKVTGQPIGNWPNIQ